MFDDFDCAPDEDTEDWTPGECDHCPGGEPIRVPFGFIYCACRIGQGADPEDCVCGPEDE
ncbi:hypothetical protein ACIPYS_20575 [Kitasatospora sp. NPDC089913]|uniref:hypothetical protein n=1 Tax=Kitasatospora sp. NPDC089913 TaxID=3364080 RepID=UPI003830E00B